MLHFTALAIIHHVLVFGLVIILAMQLSGVRAQTLDLSRLSRLDAGYGMTAVLVIAIGIARVVWGEKGWDFYQTNPFFWAKIATYASIGLISIMPTLAFMGWSRARRQDANWQPDPIEIKRTAAWIRLEILLIFPLVAFAAAMARWAG